MKLDYALGMICKLAIQLPRPTIYETAFEPTIRLEEHGDWEAVAEDSQEYRRARLEFHTHQVTNTRP